MKEVCEEQVPSSKGWLTFDLLLPRLTFLWGFQPEMGKIFESAHKTFKEVVLPIPTADMQL